jgi:hypothetical protein
MPNDNGIFGTNRLANKFRILAKDLTREKKTAWEYLWHIGMQERKGNYVSDH